MSINELANAIKSDELQVYYQPKIDVNSNTVVGVEALIRWHKADGTVVMPNDFIPLAESSNLIIPLGEYVLRSACFEVAKWLEHYPDITLAVNLSSVQFNPSFIALLNNVLAETHFPPQQFEVEITETVLINNEHAIETSNLLKKAHVKISLDDFGTGYSSLSYVKNFPLDILKIDQSFIMSMLNDTKNMSIVKTIINFAKDLSLVPVAEGVESQEHANTLKSLGCSLLQGYFYSKPISPNEIRAWLDNF
ncbi:MAG: EAL domain-containing protein [Glaciecola sp.]